MDPQPFFQTVGHSTWAFHTSRILPRSIAWLLAWAGMPCFYETLRIARKATLEEIKLAFKKLALEVHPDKGGNKEAFHQAEWLY